jgi:hypothetical protein
MLATSSSALSAMSGYCAEPGAMAAPNSGANAASATAIHGSLRYHGRDVSEAAGSTRAAGARLGSGCGAAFDLRGSVGGGAGCGPGRTNGVVAAVEATCVGFFGARTGRE